MSWFVSDWETIGAVAASTAAIYVAILIGVRLAGRRTVSQMSAFDFVVTVAIGSLAANTALNLETSITQGVTGLATLLVLQASLGWARRRWRSVERVADFAPLIVVRRGSVDDSGMRTPQMTLRELKGKLRAKGVFRIEDVRVAILEPDGELSLIAEPDLENDIDDLRESLDA